MALEAEKLTEEQIREQEEKLKNRKADVIDFPKPAEEADTKSEKAAGNTFEKVSFLNERIDVFNKAAELLPEKDAETVGKVLKGIEEQRDELSEKLSDEQMQELGLGKLRARQLDEKIKSLEKSAGLFDESDRELIMKKNKDLIARMKKIVESFNEEDKEEFSKQVNEKGVILLGLEEHRIKHINEALDILKKASKLTKEQEKRDVISEKIRILDEKRRIFAGNLSRGKREELGIEGTEGMSDEKIREEYGIKTLEEYQDELKAA